MPGSSNDHARSIDQSKHSQSMFKLEANTQQMSAYSNNFGPTMSGMKSAHNAHHSASHSALQPHHHEIMAPPTGS